MDSGSDVELIEQIADEFTVRQQRGEKPTIREYADRYPELASEIQEVFPALVLMEQVRPVSADLKESQGAESPTVKIETLGDYRILREIGRGGMGIVYEAEQESLRRRVALKVLPKQNATNPRALQRFEREARAAARMHHTNIVPVFDVGHVDEWVFYAMQLIQGQSLDLVINDLKRIRSQPAAAAAKSDQCGPEGESPSLAASLIAGTFQEEDLATELNVTGIASGVDESLPETVEQPSGSSVSAVLPGQSESTSADSNPGGYYNSIAQIGLQTARALAYAHARGIVHRDIKPSNLLLDAAGTVWVTDFGLAQTGDDRMTHTGDILGTIRYMSPERFRGQCDNRADVYSLGLTLYELLVLRPAFSSSDRLRLIERVTKTEPEKPRSRDSRIPIDLETVVLKCIDKDPKRRYQSADELADDLQRFVSDEPIQARRISIFERAARWARRNKSLAASLAAVALLLLVINIAGPIMTWKMAGMNANLETTNQDLEQTVQELNQTQSDLDAALTLSRQRERRANEAERKAVQERERTRRNLYFAHMNMAQAAFDAGDFARCMDLVDVWAYPDGETDLRSFEWYLLNSHVSRSEWVRTLRGHLREIVSLSWSPDGERILSGSRDGTIRTWDVRTGNPGPMIQGYKAGIWGVDWHPTDANRVAAASTNRSVKVFDLATGKEVWSQGHSRWVFDVKWSPDGRRLASCGWDNLRIWDAATGKQLHQAGATARGGFTHASWHPKGKKLAFASEFDPILRILDLESGKITRLEGHSRSVQGVDWHADGRRLVSCGGGGEIILWDVDAESQLKTLEGHHFKSTVTSVTWNPVRSDLLLSAGSDKTVRVWDVETGGVVDSLVGSQVAAEADWSPSGEEFVFGGKDQTLEIWRLRVIESHLAEGSSVVFPASLDWSDDSDLIVTGQTDGTIELTDPTTMQPVAVLSDDGSGVQEDFSRNLVRAVQISPGGKRLASGGVDGHLKIWDLETRRLIGRSEETHKRGSSRYPYHGIEDLCWDPNERFVITVGWDDVIRVWDPEGMQLRKRIEVPGGTLSVALNRDGTRMVTGSAESQPILVWETETWTRIGALASDELEIKSIQFGPDGDRLAACGGRDRDSRRDEFQEREGWLRVWDIDGPTPEHWAMTEIASGDDIFIDLSWTPDGKRIAAASLSGQTRLWDVSSTDSGGIGRQMLSFASSPDWLASSRFSPDGKKLAVTANYAITVYDASAGYQQQ